MATRTMKICLSKKTQVWMVILSSLAVILYTFRGDTSIGFIHRNNTVDPDMRTLNLPSFLKDASTAAETEARMQVKSVNTRPEQTNYVSSDRNRNETRRKLNVLFIMSDDMRAQISPYHDGDSPFASPRLLTPSLEKLASRSLLLKNMFVQYSLCGPSRTSMLTSRRPDVTGIYDNNHYWRTVAGNFTTLPQYFKEHGYLTHGIGKIFHRGASSNNNDPISWSRKYDKGRQTEKAHMESLSGEGAGLLAIKEEAERQLPLTDTMTMELAKDVLRELAPRALSGEQHFFLAVGFKKPHLSFTCPERYFKLYPKESEKQFLADVDWQQPKVGRGCHIRNASRINEQIGFVPDDVLREYRQAYFACISYTDSLIGELVETVDSLGLGKDTIISFIADHGYHLGENGLFGKHTLYDTSTRVPAMIHIPGRTDHGITSSALLEAVDVFPTITEAAGLGTIDQCPDKSSDVPLCTQGKSFLPLVDKPEKGTKEYVISQVRKGVKFMRYSIRTKDFRYTQWNPEPSPEALKNMVLANRSSAFIVELYDLRNDKAEKHNIISVSQYSDTLYNLKVMLEKAINL